MEVAEKSGALLSYDPNLRLALWPTAEEARHRIMSVWDKADIVKVSDTEVEFLTGKAFQYDHDDDVAMTLWRPTFKLMIVSLGAKGCKYYTKDFHGLVEAFKVKQVDTTGAGDAFVGAMLFKIVQDRSALLDEKRLRELLKYANACGAITATKKGAIPALPRPAEVLAFMDKAN